MADSNSWKAIFDYKNINSFNFDNGPYILQAEDIKIACQHFIETSQREVRILCKQDSREDRPDVFVQKNLFILPKKNGSYYIVKGEGYVDIPNITTKTIFPFLFFKSFHSYSYLILLSFLYYLTTLSNFI